jgi:alpha-glucoside transport system substrate-binding protein
MRRSGRRGWAVPTLLLVAALVLGGCGDTAPSLAGEVEVLGSLSGSELSAFQAVVAPFEERTGVSVTYASTRDLRGVLAGRIEAGDPPDIAGLEGPAHMRELAEAGELEDLAEVLDMRKYRSTVAPTFIDLGTVNGRLVGVFVRSSVKGLVWHNPAVFQLGTPRTWDELQRMAVQSADRAEAEWCVGLASQESSGWPGTDLVEQFLLREAGVDAYDRWVAGELAWTSPELHRAFELFGQVVAEGSAFGGTEGVLATPFDEAGAPLFSEPPGCLFLNQGSFMPAFFADAGAEPGTDFDFFPFPELSASRPTASTVIGAGDLFGLLTESPAAAELMRYLVSDEAQTLWVAQGGTLSVNAGVRDYPDPVSRRAAALLSGASAFRFDASDLMPPALNAAFWRAILDYIADRGRLDEILAGLDALRVDAYRG